MTHEILPQTTPGKHTSDTSEGPSLGISDGFASDIPEGFALGTPKGLFQIRRSDYAKCFFPFQALVLEGLCIDIFVKGPEKGNV